MPAKLPSIEARHACSRVTWNMKVRYAEQDSRGGQAEPPSAGRVPSSRWARHTQGRLPGWLNGNGA
eukprot:scaffold21436_cov28-Tisochrysis_lutea.AAC.3